MRTLTQFAMPARKVSTATASALASEHVPDRAIRAFQAPHEDFECGLVALVTGLAQYADSHAARFGSPIAEDAYLGDAWETAATAVKNLLNGELGRLDGGQLDGALRAMATAAGFDGDTL